MDVPRASDKPRQTICQYPLNGRFNQRWKIRRFENSSFIVTISNLKSKHYLQINDGKDKEGISICQEEYTGDAAQLWIL